MKLQHSALCSLVLSLLAGIIIAILISGFLGWVFAFLITFFTFILWTIIIHMVSNKLYKDSEDKTRMLLCITTLISLYLFALYEWSLIHDKPFKMQLIFQILYVTFVCGALILPVFPMIRKLKAIKKTKT